VPTNYFAPGVYVEEVSTGARPIQAVGTSTCGFVGEAPSAGARVNEAVPINNWTEFLKNYVQEGSVSTPLSHAVFGYFENGGRRCFVVNVGKDQPIVGGGKGRSGLDLLETRDDIAIIAAPGRFDPVSHDALLSQSEKLQDRIAILDPPPQVETIDALTQIATASATSGKGSASAPVGWRPRNSDHGFGAFYFPYLTVRDPLSPKDLVNVAPSGHIAGIYARTDAERGVHKAPANATLRGAVNVTYQVTREEQATLNTAGVNCIRFFPQQGILVWGSRTLAESASEWKYVPVRRLFTMVENSIGRSTRWVVFEPNDYVLWKAIKRDVGAFLRLLWRDGALMGRTPEEAFFVKCDEETNPPESVDSGRVVILIGLAPVKPAEFVIFRIGQYAGGTEVQSEGGVNG
jgi:phage tail sheath protein FI